MLTCNDYEFPLIVYNAIDDPDYSPEPFTYIVRTEVSDAGVTVRASCFDIPCELCTFSCKGGVNRTVVLGLLIKDKFPELLI